MKHSKGPWKVEYLGEASNKYVIRAADKRVLAKIAAHHGDNPMYPYVKFTMSEQDFTDAKLMAKAPEYRELLEALYNNRRLLNDSQFQSLTDKLFDMVREALEE